MTLGKRLVGKIIMITGAAQGMGRQASIEFAQQVQLFTQAIFNLLFWRVSALRSLMLGQDLFSGAGCD